MTYVTFPSSRGTGLCLSEYSSKSVVHINVLLPLPLELDSDISKAFTLMTTVSAWSFKGLFLKPKS